MSIIPPPQLAHQARLPAAGSGKWARAPSPRPIGEVRRPGPRERRKSSLFVYHLSRHLLIVCVWKFTCRAGSLWSRTSSMAVWCWSPLSRDGSGNGRVVGSAPPSVAKVRQSTSLLLWIFFWSKGVMFEIVGSCWQGFEWGIHAH